MSARGVARARRAPGEVLLALDIGTSATKAALVTLRGQQVAAAAVTYASSYPAPTWCEQDAETWWVSAAKATREALACLESGAARVVGVSVSGQGPSCLPIDSRGTPLRPAILWMDRRASVQADEIVDKLGPAAERISGNRVDGSFGGPKWMWLRDREPHVYRRAWKLVQANGYVVFRLTGAVATDDSHAAICAPFYDLGRRCWSDDVLAALGLRAELLPEIVQPTQVVGTVSREASTATGLPVGTPVVAGAGDAACAVLGAGVTEPGSFVLMLGTSGNIMGPVREDAPVDTRLVNTVHVTGDRLVSGTTYAGGMLQWLRDLLGLAESASEDAPSVFARLDESASAVGAGAAGILMLPYLMGDRTPLWDPWVRGVIVGLTPFHGPAHLYRAALEAVSFALRSLADIIEELGEPVEELVLVEGGAKSGLWRQILADVLGARIHRTATGGATLLGGAAVAGAGIGALGGLSATRGWQERISTETPDPLRAQHYERAHKLFQRLYETTQPLFPELAALAVAAPMHQPDGTAGQ